MKKSLLLVLLSFILISTLKAQTLDTLSSRYVGPGILYTDIIARKVPWTIKVLRVELKNPYISFEAVKAKDTYFGNERTSAMAQRRTFTGHNVVGAVNADYYDTQNGAITNIQVGNGQMYRGPQNVSLIGFDINNKPMIDICKLNSFVVSGATSLKINEVNQARGTNQLILYNFYKGTATGTDASGSEALLRPTAQWLVNDTLKCVVEKVEDKAGNMAIPAGKAVLSGNGTAASYIMDNLHAGDTVKLYMGITTSLKKIKELVGGHPRLVKNGVNYLDEALKGGEPGSSTTTPAPRTIAGISKDTTYLYLVTLDGRQTSSAGATLDDLANLMIRLGLYDAFNLDGGGSTTMVVRNNVMNSPSDGSERSVANCLLVVSSAPKAPDTLGRVGFTYNYSKFLIYSAQRLQLSTYANDKYENAAVIDPSQLSFRVSPELGKIDNSGYFTAVKTPAKGYIYLKYKNLTDSSYISLIPITKLTLPDPLVIDATKSVKLIAHVFASDESERTVATTDISWKSLDTNIAVVNATGYLMGKSEGKVKIVASFLDDVADTLEVTVLIGRGTTVVSPMDSLAGWSLSGSNVDLTASKLGVSGESKSEGAASLKVDFNYAYDPSFTNLVYLDTNIPFYGIPDTVFIDARTDTSTNQIFLVVANDQNKTFRIPASLDISGSDRFRKIPFVMKKNIPLNGVPITYPVRLTRIVVQPQYNDTRRIAGQKYSGTFYLDNLRLKYPAATNAVGVDEKKLPEGYWLMQNYPNPFNPSTVIKFRTVQEGNTSLRVYDLLGREVAVLINGRLAAGEHSATWDASRCPSGIYFYRLISGSFIETKKMLLVR
ncbi:MAG: T9SS type A sorting domain-containing protein [Ignavibacteria bacterium]|jgi:exopolysaccharide biosynthesis protein|nr:T9SS type A sorting domain-containing protein [Ignavibacteria bacterium]MCU7502072.1 T9SS type A sorting domain-containing protein [Ignavibacteria bacterium]MCU7515474.1 T9SS type A sorting domain-containing protein [Ignavibacteria bacterium]